MVKLSQCLVVLLILSLSPMTAWSDETSPDPAAPPATTDVSNEGVPPAPAADTNMGAGSPEEAPADVTAERPAKKKRKAAKHAKKKAGKHGKKKAGKHAKKKKKKHHY
jgi:hypothetical protein